MCLLTDDIDRQHLCSGIAVSHRCFANRTGGDRRFPCGASRPMKQAMTRPIPTAAIAVAVAAGVDRRRPCRRCRRRSRRRWSRPRCTAQPRRRHDGDGDRRRGLHPPRGQRAQGAAAGLLARQPPLRDRMGALPQPGEDLRRPRPDLQPRRPAPAAMPPTAAAGRRRSPDGAIEVDAGAAVGGPAARAARPTMATSSTTGRSTASMPEGRVVITLRGGDGHLRRRHALHAPPPSARASPTSPSAPLDGAAHQPPRRPGGDRARPPRGGAGGDAGGARRPRRRGRRRHLRPHQPARRRRHHRPLRLEGERRRPPPPGGVRGDRRHGADDLALPRPELPARRRRPAARRRPRTGRRSATSSSTGSSPPCAPSPCRRSGTPTIRR